MLEFKDEMLIPKINGEIYFSIYELENWLRRICLSVYMLEYGESWLTEVPRRIYEGYRQRHGRNQDLFYLDADNEDNLIWSLTHAELAQLLLDNNISRAVQQLIGFPQERLSQKLNELREIRNLLAHNRALSERTEVIVRGIIASMDLAIDRFKSHFLYNNDTQILNDPGSEINNYFNSKMVNNNWSTFQAYIGEEANVYSLICLPVSREHKYPSATKLLNLYRDIMESILAFQLNKTGDEYIITFPKRISVENIKIIIDKFLSRSDIWTSRSFEEQHPRYICNPKIWFYENQRPLEE